MSASDMTSIRPILTIPEPVLRQTAEPVERVDEDLRKLMDDMLATMYDAPGVGLAAPQIGISRRVIVMDPARDDEEPAPLVMANPVILDRSEEMRVQEEGCLSIPDVTAEVERPAAGARGLSGSRGQAARGGARRVLVHDRPARGRPSERGLVHRLSVPSEARHDRAEIHQAKARNRNLTPAKRLPLRIEPA